MIRVLNVAEKPSVAKEISIILGNNRAKVRRGHSKENIIYDFEYTINGQSCQMSMTSVRGHLTETEFGPEYKNWKSPPPQAIFEAPIIRFIPEKLKSIEKTLLAEAKKSQWLILWLDCDREGENIAFEVVNCCKQANRRLDIFRAHFSALIPDDIKMACRTLTNPNVHLSDSVDARRDLDLIVGVSFTRFLTNSLQNKFPDLNKKVISYGPCQFPTLGFVVDQYWKIQEFEVEKYWTINVEDKRGDGLAKFGWERVRLFDQLAAFIFYESCIENPLAKVVSVISKPKSRWAPVPLNTVLLQKLAAQKLRISSEQTMHIAESLYQKGFISYPRTETNIFKEGSNLQHFISLQCEDNRWGQYAQSLLGGKFVHPRRGRGNDQSHPPIHPTKYTNALTGNEKTLYDFIVRHFLACCSDDARGLETKVTILIADETFSSAGLMIEHMNYLEVYPFEKWSDKTIPLYRMNETFTPTSILFHSGQTEPPLPLAENELIELMDKNGIGTDATIATHIETILKREYAQKIDNRFHPTTLGIAIVEAYRRMGFDLDKPRLRALMEKDMKEIAEGKLSKQSVVKKGCELYKDILLRSQLQTNVLQETVLHYFSH